MPYAVELSNDAAAILRRLPVDVVVCVSNHLGALAADPVRLGRRATFPYRPDGQIYEFWCDSADDAFFVTVFFHYVGGQDTLRVFTIGFRSYKRD